MKWTYSIQNKLTASGVLLTLCVLVLFSNYVDRDHTNNVKNSISTLYEDRLIVEDYILKMTIDIYEIKQALHVAGRGGEPSAGQVTALLSHIDGLSEAYLKTKFTKDEDVTFAELLSTLNKFEASASQSDEDKLELANQALVLLNELSSIQLEESKLIMKQVEELYISGKVASQFAFGITIIILVVLQALVFTSKTLPKTLPPSGAQLN
ncbi:MAG: hypothetical protein KF803_06490 [Cyclobacteriaceae bacterium]|nr:hypothetical protein [Cyclobacteriaceae bacterium]